MREIVHKFKNAILSRVNPLDTDTDEDPDTNEHWSICLDSKDQPHVLVESQLQAISCSKCGEYKRLSLLDPPPLHIRCLCHDFEDDNWNEEENDVWYYDDLFDMRSVTFVEYLD